MTNRGNKREGVFGNGHKRAKSRDKKGHQVTLSRKCDKRGEWRCKHHCKCKRDGQLRGKGCCRGARASDSEPAVASQAAAQPAAPELPQPVAPRGRPASHGVDVLPDGLWLPRLMGDFREAQEVFVSAMCVDHTDSAHFWRRAWREDG